MTASETFRFDTGRPCLDFVATVGHRFTDAPVERLSTAARLREWLCGARLIPPGATVPVTDEWLPHFWELRTVVYRVIHAVTWDEPVRTADIDTLNSYLSYPAPVVRVNRAARKPRLRMTIQPDVDHRAFLSILATDTATLVTGDDHTRLRECAASICGVIYLDFAHGRERLWCSKAVCGNRERIARHRQKIRDARPAR